MAIRKAILKSFKSQLNRAWMVPSKDSTVLSSPMELQAQEKHFQSLVIRKYRKIGGFVF